MGGGTGLAQLEPSLPVFPSDGVPVSTLCRSSLLPQKARLRPHENRRFGGRCIPHERPRAVRATMTMSAAWASPGVEITPQGLMPARKHDTSDDRLVRKILQANRSVSSLSLEQQQSLSRKASEKGFGFGGVVYQHPSALHDGLLCYHVTSPLRRFGKAKAMSWRAGLRTGVLRVTVTQAYGLAAADLRGTSDPYVVAEFGGQKKKTSIIMRTLAPAWGETLQVYGLLDDFLDSGVKLQVFDWDEVGMDDVLGECAIKLQEELRLTNQEFTKEYVERLSPEGHIIFKVTWVPETDGPPQWSPAVAPVTPRESPEVSPSKPAAPAAAPADAIDFAPVPAPAAAPAAAPAGAPAVVLVSHASAPAAAAPVAMAKPAKSKLVSDDNAVPAPAGSPQRYSLAPVAAPCAALPAMPSSALTPRTPRGSIDRPEWADAPVPSCSASSAQLLAGSYITQSRAALAVKERVRSAGPVRIPVLLPHKFDYVQLSYERIAQAEQAQKTKEEYAARLAGKLPWPKPRPTKLKLGKAKSSPALVRPPSSKIFANEAFQTGQQVR